jgi:hypothetical protein
MAVRAWEVGQHPQDPVATRCNARRSWAVLRCMQGDERMGDGEEGIRIASAHYALQTRLPHSSPRAAASATSGRFAAKLTRQAPPDDNNVWGHRRAQSRVVGPVTLSGKVPFISMRCHAQRKPAARRAAPPHRPNASPWSSDTNTGTPRGPKVKLHAKRGRSDSAQRRRAPASKEPAECALLSRRVRADVVRDCEDVRLRSRAAVVRGRCIPGGVQQQYFLRRHYDCHV